MDLEQLKEQQPQRSLVYEYDLGYKNIPIENFMYWKEPDEDDIAKAFHTNNDEYITQAIQSQITKRQYLKDNLYKHSADEQEEILKALSQLKPKPTLDEPEPEHK